MDQLGVDRVDVYRPSDGGRPLEECLKQLKADIQNSSSAPLISNYSNYGEVIADSICTTACFGSDRLLGVSTLWQGHFGGAWARALNRTYYTSFYRNRASSRLSIPNLASGIMLPIQIEVAQSMGLSGVLITMEGERGVSYIERVTSSLPNNSYGCWKVLPGPHNTCRLLPNGQINPDKGCWQTVGYLSLKKDSKPVLPKKNEHL